MGWLQVVWLDVTAAKARYGRWLDGAIPAFVPFPKTTRARTKQQQQQQQEKEAALAADQAGANSSEADGEFIIRMRRLRCVHTGGMARIAELR